MTGTGRTTSVGQRKASSLRPGRWKKYFQSILDSLYLSRRVKLEGHVDDPFTRRKTVPKIATAKQKEDEEDEEMEMTTERLLYMEERKRLKAEEEKQKQLQQREDIRRKMEDEDAGALTKKVGKKSGAGSSKASTQDIFNAHNFDLDINVSEMGVCFFAFQI